MDRYAQILSSLPGLKDRLDQADVERWLKEQKRVEVEGQSLVVLHGDRLASEAEAKLTFALERGLVAPDDVRSAAAALPLQPGTEAVEIDTPEGDQ
jgi:hypothetical protein